MIQGAIARHLHHRLADEVNSVGERLLKAQREAAEASKEQAEVQVRIADLSERYVRELVAGIRDGSLGRNRDLELRIEVQQALLLGASMQLNLCTKQINELVVELADMANQKADSIADDDVVIALRKELEDAREEERKVARKTQDEEDWLDLPEYHGEALRKRRDCLHCGGELEDYQRTYCSDHCKAVHQTVFGGWEDE